MYLAGQINWALEGVAAQTAIEVQGNRVLKIEKEHSAAKSGTLSARTDADTGTFTGTSHGISTGEKVDVYWSGGSRYNMTVGTVSGNDVPLDGGSGDDLPAATTAMTIMKHQEHEYVVDGDDVKALAATCSKRATFHLATSAGAIQHSIQVAAGGTYLWYTGNGVTNPIAGDAITKIFITHEDSENAQSPVLVGLLN